MPRYAYEPFDYVTPPELAGGPASEAPVAIVGAGPVGLAMAIDLATRGIASVVLDDNNVVSVGSRAICWAKRTLEIFDRLGVGERMLAKGVTWQVGRLFHGHDQVYAFDLLPEAGHKYPAFINLQQYYVEQYLVERARDFPDLVDLRFKNKVVDHSASEAGVLLTIETPDGTYALEAQFLLACDGAGSPTRKRMGLAFDGQTFDEHFLIADVEMEDSPFDNPDTAERWFWFRPPFHPGQSALLHKQPDNIYRIDLQLYPDADPSSEATEDKVFPRIKAIVGDRPFQLDWMSVYKFRCARLEKFVHGRVIFVGDSAHVVSPFGARGGNGGVQDVDNLGWKLAAVLNGQAPETLLQSYHQERAFAADENIRNSSRATNFMTPKSPVEQMFRNQVLTLAGDQGFARKLINSGRLSQPCSLAGMPLQSDDGAAVTGRAVPDAPIRIKGQPGWLIEEMSGDWVLLSVGAGPAPDPGAPIRQAVIGAGDGCLEDTAGFAAARYGEMSAHLIRPDGHVAASFGGLPAPDQVQAAYRRAMGLAT